MNDSDYGKSVEIAGCNIENDLNGGILANGAEVASSIIRKKTALNDAIYKMVTSKYFQDNYRFANSIDVYLCFYLIN